MIVGISIRDSHPHRIPPTKLRISWTMLKASSDRRNEDPRVGSRFSEYDTPRATRGSNTEGNYGDGGGIPPRGGNVTGGGEMRDSGSSSDSDNSDSPPFDLCKLLGGCRDHLDQTRKQMYHQ